LNGIKEFRIRENGVGIVKHNQLHIVTCATTVITVSGIAKVIRVFSHIFAVTEFAVAAGVAVFVFGALEVTLTFFFLIQNAVTTEEVLIDVTTTFFRTVFAKQALCVPLAFFTRIEKSITA